VLLKKIQGVAILLTFSIITIVCSAKGFVYQQASKDKAEVDGEKLFLRECKDCHGEDGRGRMLHQADFTNPEWHKTVTDDNLFKTIKFGREPMPFYAGALTDDQIRALVKYIRSLGKGAKKESAQLNDSNVSTRASDKSSSQQTTASTIQAQTNNCSTCHAQQKDAVVDLLSHSTHAKANIKCNNCHGGEPVASSREAAHANNFVGKPTTKETISICGACHTAPLVAFKASLHFPERAGAPRMDCAQCHGAHTVGSVARGFSFALTCAGCHGLEYLPALPNEFQRMLALVDDEYASLASLESAGRKASDEIMRRRKEIRRMVGQIVHSTDVNGGLEKIPQIMKLGSEFKSIIEQENR
jgi:mono/diheme cytochrome c family protein